MLSHTWRISTAVLTFVAVTSPHIGQLTVRSIAPIRQPPTVDRSAAASFRTFSPIKHLVIIYQENESFDHYFATYPHARNSRGIPQFQPARGTPTVNGLRGPLLTQNPNEAQPFLLSRQQALTCDMDHGYTAEQAAVDHGFMDKFVSKLVTPPQPGQYCPKGIVMGYYDGNTITALWNYAQHFAMSDDSFGTTFGPSTLGAINLISGNTGTAVCGARSGVLGNLPQCSTGSPPPVSVSANLKIGTLYGDEEPYYDDCEAGKTNKEGTVALVGPNIGDLLNARRITWGWFQGGFDHCLTSHALGAYDLQVAHVDPHKDRRIIQDYQSHWEPFQYYASTSNPHHLQPTSVSKIGHTDQANHQYDLSDFWAAVRANNLPAVSFLKAATYQSGHPGRSDPLDEQAFLVDTINRLQRIPAWSTTAIVMSWDDSGGWYDHVMGPIVHHSVSPHDLSCGTRSDGVPGRCGYGPRLPYLVISPYARRNFVDHQLTDQSSTTRFIEDNWLNGKRLKTIRLRGVESASFDSSAGSINAMFDFRKGHSRTTRLILSPSTGEPVRQVVSL